VIVGVGIDLVNTCRVRRELEIRAWSVEDGIFTSDEISFCNRGRDPAARYAACFAAKEAAIKALGMQVENLSCFREIEVLPDSEGKFRLGLKGHPQAVSQKLNVSRVLVAVASSVTSGSALVVLET